MTISYMQAENCPRCGAVLSYYDTFSTTGKVERKGRPSMALSYLT